MCLSITYVELLYFYYNTMCLLQVIYVTRNPKDTCVSYYHHCQLIEGYKGDFEDFYKLFLDDARKEKYY